MSGKVAGRVGLQLSAWNLLLLLPLLMLVTPWFNFDKPRLFGLPFFYWFQFLFVLVGVGSVAIVFVMTKGKPVVAGKPDRLAGEGLDEGDR
jgi:uncharacterized protein DUF3311